MVDMGFEITTALVKIHTEQFRKTRIGDLDSFLDGAMAALVAFSVRDENEILITAAGRPTRLLVDAIEASIDAASEPCRGVGEP